MPLTHYSQTVVFLQWWHHTVKSGSAFKGQLYFQVGQMEEPKGARKSNTRFRFVPKSTTLDDHELTLSGYYALCYITHMSFGAYHKNF